LNRPSRILLVDDDVAAIGAMRKILADVGQIRFATSGSDALQLARESMPDVVLMDVEMPGMSGLDVCAAMKRDPVLRDVPVIFVTSHHGTEEEVAGLSVGAMDFISKPPNPPLVVARVRTQLRLKEMADTLRRTATTDSLTGVANRRRFDEVLAQEWPRAVRSGSSLAMLMIDVDYFKSYNDRYGHQGGDQCLIAVADAVRSIPYRSSDLAARYGGEEFAVLLPETSLHGASLVAARILQSVDALSIPSEVMPVADHVTVSIGVSAYCCAPLQDQSALVDTMSNLPTSGVLVAAADRALYAAKRLGRHQVRSLRLEDANAPDKALLVDAGEVLIAMSTGQFDALRA
jgi:diguanylate cyclase (GGDEF)-like protein